MLCLYYMISTIKLLHHKTFDTSFYLIKLCDLMLKKLSGDQSVINDQRHYVIPLGLSSLSID